MDTSVTSSAGGANVVKVESRIGFLGGGQMALALGKGFMQSGLVAPSQVQFILPVPYFGKRRQASYHHMYL